MIDETEKQEEPAPPKNRQSSFINYTPDKSVFEKKSGVKKKPGRKKRVKKVFEKTEEMSQKVEIWRALNMNQVSMARQLGIGHALLVKKFKQELAYGKDVCNGKVAERIFRQAISEDKNTYTAQCQKQWMSNIAGWKETTSTELTGKDGSNILAGMTDTEKAQRMGRLYQLSEMSKKKKDEPEEQTG